MREIFFKIKAIILIGFIKMRKKRERMTSCRTCFGTSSTQRFAYRMRICMWDAETSSACLKNK
jgi:hypothetical protein